MKLDVRIQYFRLEELSKIQFLIYFSIYKRKLYESACAKQKCRTQPIRFLSQHLQRHINVFVFHDFCEIFGLQVDFLNRSEYFSV